MASRLINLDLRCDGSGNSRIRTRQESKTTDNVLKETASWLLITAPTDGSVAKLSDIAETFPCWRFSDGSG